MLLWSAKLKPSQRWLAHSMTARLIFKTVSRSSRAKTSKEHLNSSFLILMKKQKKPSISFRKVRIICTSYQPPIKMIFLMLPVLKDDNMLKSLQSKLVKMASWKPLTSCWQPERNKIDCIKVFKPVISTDTLTLQCVSNWIVFQESDATSYSKYSMQLLCSPSECSSSQASRVGSATEN